MAFKRRNRFFGSYSTTISRKIKESFVSVLPVVLVVLLLSVSLTPIDSGAFLAFIFGCLLVVVGMGLFTLGAENAMTPIGRYISASVIKTRKLWLILPLFFLVGVFITVSEPDLQVLASELNGTINHIALISVVGAGVGVFLVVAFLRIVLNIKLKFVLMSCYIAMFILAFFVPKNFVPLAFDAGGVTTGPMSVPFIIAMGTGVAYLRSDKSAKDDSFGLTALCSVGPILAVMILGIIYKPDSVKVSGGEIFTVADSKDLFSVYLFRLPEYMKEVGVALLPIVAFYFITMTFGGKVARGEFVKILVGIVYAYLGLVVFLLGVNCGFLPVGNIIGRTLGLSSYAFSIVPIGMVSGFFVAGAEPAVHILGDQVVEITGGAIPKRAITLSLMAGVAVSAGLAFLRIYFSVPIMYFLIPGYAVALVLTFIVPDIFTAIAFDSGGVASGSMTVGFLMPMALGFCDALGKDLGTEGFGVVAFVAMTPLVAVQILGLIFKIKSAKIKKAHALADKPPKVKKAKSEEIID
ncbi:MAG: DUF1538 domain-containing protein [Clostridia bacterium]|nr:DUF1538 domain-containing protein [Clostridia bacterium]